MKLTFSKQALMPNGLVAESSSGGGGGGGSSRKRHKEPEVNFDLLCCTCDPLMTNEVLA